MTETDRPKAQFPVLDHGFVRIVDIMGDDEAVVQAARVSYGDGTKTPSEDRALIRYLMRNHHTSPFEMCEIKLHCKMPIFVARQWIRHRTASVNEYSGRYSIMRDEFYVPDPSQITMQSEVNKQGRTVRAQVDDAITIADAMRSHAQDQFTFYHALLERDGVLGVARELARIGLPLSAYTEWYWKIDLHNLLHFLRLRTDGHAQWEIRQYADMIAGIVEAWVPHTYEAWVDYVRDAVTLSRLECAAMRLGLHPADGPAVVDELRELGMTAREVEEFANKLVLLGD